MLCGAINSAKKACLDKGKAMKTSSVSSAFTTGKISVTKNFYVKYLGAKITFDCGYM